MDGIIILIIIAVGIYIFSSRKNGNSENKTEIKPIQNESKRFVRVIFKKGDTKQYDYFLGNNFNLKVGDFVEVIAHGKFNDKDELKIVQIVYISEPGEISYRANKTVLRKSAYQGW